MTDETPDIIASWQVRINLRGSEEDRKRLITNEQLETRLVDAMSDMLDDRAFSEEASVTVDAERLDK